MKHLLYITSLLLLVVIQQSCSVKQDKSIETSNPSTSILPLSTQSTMSEATHSLLLQADKQFNASRYEAALSTLERALRIQARQAETWSAMARVYLHMKQFDKAIQHARRSNSYIKEHTELKKFNLSLINAAKQKKLF